MNDEEPLFFDCCGDRLLGVLHRPVDRSIGVGVLLVVGGPQYRVGSHRQFVLLARVLAKAGIPVFRFDYRGMGDSTGRRHDFEEISSDIASAADLLFAEVADIRGTVLWGLCDAATANAFYACSDDRVIGQIAANPWVRTAEGEAEAYIKHYYLHRLLNREFWRKILGLKFNAAEAARDFIAKLGQSRGTSKETLASVDEMPLPHRLRGAQTAFGKPTLLILSGQDLTAREYEDRVRESRAWSGWMAGSDVTVCRLPAADHTFSRTAWRDQVSSWSRDWILNLTT